MNDSEFEQAIEDALAETETRIDAADADIDYDTVGGVLTLEFADGSKIIVNRQLANHQLWVAAKSGGFHFNLDGKQWICDDKEYFAMLSELCSLHAGEPIQL